MSDFTFGSLFAGIGGLDLGLERTGMHCAWQVETDKYCNRVLERHWPDVRRYGDVRECGSHNLEPVDLICGGFPCTDVSVAGRRKGLAGERSGLWFEFLRIVEELRPCWVLVENVPGLLSSQQGRDFTTILSGLAECGYVGTWRILDAQNFGVPQRRRRIFIVGHLGDGRAAEVLFEREGGKGHTPQGRKARQGITAPLKASSPSRRGAGSWPIAEEFVTAFNWQSGGDCRQNPAQGRTDALQASQTVAVGYTIQTNDGGEHKRKDRPEGGIYVKEADKSLALGSSDGVLVTGWHENKQGELTPDAKKSKALRAGASYSYQGVALSENQRGELRETPYSRSVTSGGGKPGQGYPAARVGMVVRRLTPTECERLQGFPDGFTDHQSDTARYRQLGNAVCVPVAEWIGRRILRVE